MTTKPCIPSEMNPPLAAVLVTDASGMANVAGFLCTVKEFGLDIETNVVKHFFERRIRTIQIGNRYNQYVIDMLAFAGSTEVLLNGMGHYRHDPCFKPVVETLRPFLESSTHTKVGHGLDFEYETLKWNLGLRPFCFWDTLEVEKVIYAGQVHYFAHNFWGLEDLTARYCGLEISKDAQKSFNLTDPLTQEQIEYAALDVRFPVAIKSGQMLQVERAKLQKTVEIENDAIPAFGDMHLNGLMIDQETWKAELERVNTLHQKNIESLDEQFIPLVGVAEFPFVPEYLSMLEKRWRDETNREARVEARLEYQAAMKACTAYRKKSAKFEGKANISYGSPSQLLKALQAAGYKLSSTSDDALEQLEGDSVIDAIRAYRTTEQILDTMGLPYLEQHIDKRTGRVHSKFNQIGAATGRTSSTKPNVQNINKKSAWRSCFIARPGYVMITIDYSGCELRILAEASGEQVWIDAFNKGWDVHSVGAEIVFGDRWKNGACKGGEFLVKNKKGEMVPNPPCAYYYGDHQKCDCPEHKKLRDQIKAINFGIAYGMEAKKLGRQVGITTAEAKKLLATWRKAFPAVVAYLEKTGSAAKLRLESRTLAGRVRYYLKPDYNTAKERAMERAAENNKPCSSRDINWVYSGMFGSIEREGKNSPIQGSNADFIKLAMGAGIGYIWLQLEPVFGGLIENMVHDELVVECPIDTAEACMDFLGGCMMRAGGEFMKLVKAESEGKIAPMWSK